jgi:archaellum biogenesis ATPase FlaH
MASSLSTISSTEIPHVVLVNLLRNEDFCRKVFPFLRSEYFEDESRVIFDLFVKFFSEYNSMPSQKALEIEFTRSDKNTEANGSVLDHLASLYRENTDYLSVDEDWLISTTEQWCQDRAVYLAVLQSINIIDGGDKEHSPGAIPDILSKALSVSFDRKIGHDYIENAKDRFDFYHQIEEKIPFDLEMLNKITKNGVSRKTLNVILAGTGVGKSLAMCHFASAMLAQGKNVLYITMEMAEEKIAERIDANLFDVDISDLRSLDQREFDTKIHDIQSKTSGRLVIKEYPTSQAHTGHFRALLDDLNRKKSFVPDCIFVDYLNICASSRMKGVGGSVNSYTYVKAIAEEIRGLAVERDVPIWTATQTNREGYGNSDVDLTNTSESFGLPATADLMVAMITTEELDDLDQVLVKQLKNRYNDPTYYKKFVLGIDRAKMRLYDVEDNAQSNLQTEVNEYTQQSPTSSDFVDWTTV